jgi:hypothetical protein
MAEMYEPRDAFMPFHTRSKRWACLVAHRRAGKTVACINELLTRALATSKQNARYAYIAPYYNQSKNIAWDYLKRYSASLQPKINESELQIELHNGARIRLFGADNDQALRGLYLDGVILDEYADMRPRVWGEIVRPMLADRKGWAVFIGTPKGHNSFYDIFKLSRDSEEWFSLTLRASESGLLEAAELRDARTMMTEDQYRQEFECDFEAAIPGAVYGKWMSDADAEGRIGSIDYDPNLPVFTAWDLGFDDATAIWFFQVAIGEVRLIDYYEASGEDIAHYCSVIKNKPYQYAKHFVPHDAANKLLAAGGRSIVQQAYEQGVKMYVIPATSQQNGIEAARLTLKRSWFAKAAEQGYEALKQYQFQWDDDAKIFRSKPKHDWTSHAADAFEIIGQVWKQPELLRDKEPPRFLHDMTANEVFWPTHKGPAPRNRI